MPDRNRAMSTVYSTLYTSERTTRPRQYNDMCAPVREHDIKGEKEKLSGSNKNLIF